MSYREGRFWQPDVTVACVIARDGRLLMVEERVNGEVVLNQPAGHLEAGESLVAACAREALEETACRVEPTALVGIYHWPRPDGELTYLRFAFAARWLADAPERALDEGIVRALWLSPEALRACSERHRSPLVLACVEDYLAGHRYPLTLIRHWDAA